MNKYYPIKKYAQITGQDTTTIYKQIQGRHHTTIQFTKGIETLIVKNVNNKAEIISLMNLKGGCGKTTLAAHLAAYLSKLKFKVLLVDTDHQNQCQYFFPEKHYEYTLKDVLQEKQDIKSSIYTTNTVDSELDIIYSDYDIAFLASDIDFLRKKEQLNKSLNEIEEDYDFIVIDTSPNFDIITINAALSSSHIIIPVMPVPLHIQGMSHNIKALREITKISEDKILGIIPNIVDIKRAQQSAYLEKLKEDLPYLMYGVYIPNSADISKCNDFRTNIFDYREKSKVSQALKKFVWETLTRL